MFRRGATVAVQVLIAAAVGCSMPHERTVLDQFFAASRLWDTTALAALATASFEPTIRGTVRQFEIVSLSAERREPLTTVQPADAVAGARAPGNAVSIERLIADLSLNPRADRTARAVSVEGDLVSKDVSITALVRVPDGRTLQKALVVTIARVVVRGTPQTTGRWIVTAVNESPQASPSLPRR